MPSITAVERVALAERAAVRQLVTPVGESCRTMRLGEVENGAVGIDRSMRDAIEAADPVEIGRETVYEIFLTELDLKNRSCKFVLRNDEDQSHRMDGEITDPVLSRPNNPYSGALSAQRWLVVRGKPEMRDGELAKIFISDACLPALPSP